MKISQYRLARDIGVSPRRINEIVHGKRSISADTALRLSRHFGMSERFWMNLQARYDIEVEKDRLAGRLGPGVRLRAGGGEPRQEKERGPKIKGRSLTFWKVSRTSPFYGLKVLRT